MIEKDVLWVADELGASRVVTGGGNVQFSCLLAPWRHKKGTDRHPSMGISYGETVRSLVNCFGCGFGGTVEQLLDALELHADTDLDEIRWKVIELEEDGLLDAVRAVEDYDAPPAKDDDDGLLPGVMYEKFAPLHEEARDYMMGRGFTVQAMEAWSVGFDKERHRATVPLRNRNGRLAGALGRTTRDDPQRWHTYWNAKKSRHLFGAHLAAREAAHVVVVEGPFDAMRVWQETRGHARLGEVCPVAIMGSKPSRRQIELLCAASSCTFFLDNDPAGTTGTHILADTVAKHVPSWVARYSGDDRKDPDSLGADVVSALLESEMV
jgi:hypothetical protein